VETVGQQYGLLPLKTAEALPKQERELRSYLLNICALSLAGGEAHITDSVFRAA
jgi:hypothetical protein